MRAEEIRHKDAVIEHLERSVEAAAARYSELSNELYRLTAAAHEAKALAEELQSLRARNRAPNENYDGGVSTATGVADPASEDFDQQTEEVDVLQKIVDQGIKPLSPKCATVEDCYEGGL